MILYQSTKHVDSSDIEREDGGAALILQVENPDEEQMFVRVQSYDERAWRDNEQAHPTFNNIIGRKIRVTVEIID